MDSGNRGPSPRHEHSFSSSHRSRSAEQVISSIAEESILRDLEDEEIEHIIEDEDGHNDLDRTVSQEHHFGQHSMVGSVKRASFMAGGSRPFLGAQHPAATFSSEQDWEAAISDERSLLRDNNLIPPKNPRRASEVSHTSARGLRSRISIPGFSITRRSTGLVDEESQLNVGNSESPSEPTETTRLLPNEGSSPIGREPEVPYDSEDVPEEIDKKWEDAVLSGQIHTTWQRESKVLAKYTTPLIFTFLLQNSLTLTSVFTVGHIGKIELGAVSIGTMTANITGYAVYHGLATSLDTLCAQAYGSGKKKLVGLNLQRMVFFLWTITIPMAIIWFFADRILMVIVPEKDVALLAGQYLKILILGAPGYACFESSKRYVQAQGRFGATLYVLLIAAPANVLMHWLFVWQFEWGFIGCPIAVVITESLMPLLLFLYVRFFGGMECWPGFTWKAFANWGPMIRLALPGFVMVIAEFLAFEILTLASARISASHLAANTILQSMCVVAYFSMPFPVSIAGSTRVANLIGASLPDAAKVTTRVIFVVGTVAGLFNMIMLSSLRFYIPRLFTQDKDVIELAAATLPINAAFQLFDALAAQCNGVLRGLGKQGIGGIICLVAFYGIALPLSFGLGFGLHLDLYGLWAGPAIALGVQAFLEGLYIYKTSWQQATEDAARRNAAG